MTTAKGFHHCLPMVFKSAVPTQIGRLVYATIVWCVPVMFKSKKLIWVVWSLQTTITTLLCAGYGDDKKSGEKIINIQCLKQR